MCPEVTDEEIIKEALPSSEEEVKEDLPDEDSQETESEDQVIEDQEFEGVDKPEDIPKGKEKLYGI